MNSGDFVARFEEVLAQGGDMFFSSGDPDADMSLIRGTILSQGYWAGTSVRYYFDKDFNLTGTQERVFGA